MDEVAAGAGKHLVVPGARRVVEEVVALHSIEFEALGVGSVEPVGGGAGDLFEQGYGAETAQVGEVRPLVGAEGERRRGQFGTDRVDGVVGVFQVVAEVARAEGAVPGEQRFGAVLDGAVEAHLPGAEPAEEQQVEERRDPEIPQRRIVVEPQFDGVERVGVGVVLLRARRPQDDVELSAVGAPAGAAGVASVELVRVGDPREVLVAVFVLRGGGVRVAALPEGFDEGVAGVFAGEREECPALRFGEEVRRFLFEETPVALGHLRLRGPGARGGGRNARLRCGRARRNGDEQRRGDECGEPAERSAERSAERTPDREAHRALSAAATNGRPAS